MEEIRLPQAIAERFSPSNLAEWLAALTTGYTPNPEQELQEPTYYDYPVLKVTTWHWEIMLYFFLGGLTSGCYIIASIASLFGSPKDRAAVRAGYYLSLLALLPCPPLLIKDLGRPERFLHMLRVFKVKSPMSMGTWALMTFGLFSGLTAVIQAARDGILGRWWGERLLAALPQRLIALPGTAPAFFVGSYTGVLLATTSVPLWSRSRLLGAIFLSSAISTSSALISLVLRLTGAPASVLHKLERLEWVAMLVEMTGLLAFLRTSNRAGRALVGMGPNEQGATFWPFVFGGGLFLPWILQTLSLSGRSSDRSISARGIAISLLALIGGYFLRRTMIQAGHTSSTDARTTLWNARRPR